MALPTLLPGGSHQDKRGALSFFNTLDLGPIRRMYQIVPAHPTLIRAWQGHRREQKWFYCPQGGFVIHTVALTAPQGASAQRWELHADQPQVLHVPGGNATGIQATLPDAKLLVFSDMDTEQSQQDDVRFPVDHWEGHWKTF
ncbi:hypothetical protein [Maribacter sp. 2307ULW6-5]|uniref:hypothetical protein n=1 Tax=Maribacter sp. 2307ULW6-5 TaxID=3386275 RepID=UPI0039BC82E1